MAFYTEPTTLYDCETLSDFTVIAFEWCINKLHISKVFMHECVIVTEIEGSITWALDQVWIAPQDAQSIAIQNMKMDFLQFYQAFCMVSTGSYEPHIHPALWHS